MNEGYSGLVDGGTYSSLQRAAGFILHLSSSILLVAILLSTYNVQQSA